MGTILDKILVEKRKEVEILKSLSQYQPPQKDKQRSFISILEKSKRVSIIAEFKRASPSKGDINTSLEPGEQTKKYVESGADAVSVLTDTSFFKGTFADLEEVREAIDAPVLCKDFIIDPVQIDLAKKSGADIVLLIAAALDDIQLKGLYHYAREQNLEVLMEVHNEEEAERALKTGNGLIGVNNRNLKTFEVNLKVTEVLAPMLRKEGCFVISESGMKTVQDVERAVGAGANGILVGEAFMTNPDVRRTLRSMKEVALQ